MRNWRRLDFLFMAAIWVPLTSAAGASPQSHGVSRSYDVIVATNIMVSMRDGVKLATDVYLPAHHGELVPGKFPVLVSRTPYGKDPAPGSKNVAYYFAQLGYVVVVQDCRGRFKSQGTFYINVNEGRDGCPALRTKCRR